ncbi:hypothetical protein [Amycolatopsis solani]|uniref:hypothetical protein n=1 Tax=Amycolatopsis solani TaxID=3028615 RepID=UPI0025AEFD3D|nr:hypothetical protein [Amycolatopsis sp. MEP2-6]
MSDVVRQGRAAGLYVSWHRSDIDGRDHAVTDEEFSRGWRDALGRYEGLCGHVVLPTSMLVAPGRPCARCRAFLAARRTLPAVERRLHPPRHRKPSRWRRLFQHVPQVNVPEQAHSQSARASRARGFQTPAGAGSAPIAPVFAGRHERRSER